jgi:NAD(P)-dependent dehydrogenase (short-subunit alcohol dehydrogenase family)
MKTSVVMGTVAAIAVGLFGMYFVDKKAHLDRNYLKSLINDAKDKKYPLKDKIALVTGSTSGLGMAIATELYMLGAIVILGGRTQSKAESVAKSIKETDMNSPGDVVFITALDTSDLDSVKKFADALKAYTDDKPLDFLVNNAGIHYVSSEGQDIVSKQGFDMAFATNYLGHFLLTELLLPQLSLSGNEGRIVQISSTMHMGADGTMLQTDGIEMPEAARGDIKTNAHAEASYSNNKLAQILHAKELQKTILDRKYNNLRIVSICPNWVATNILPNNLGGKFVAMNAFTPSAGSLSAMYALLSNDLKGGEYVGNSNIWMINNEKFVNFFLSFCGNRRSLRIGFVNVLSMGVLLAERFFYGAYIMKSSPESYDKKTAKNLYKWSKKAVAAYL